MDFPYKMSTVPVGDFCGFRALLRVFTFKMSAAGENFVIQWATKGILPYKISAAGENFCGFRALLRGFYLTKRAPQAKILRFQGATRRISY